jgi:hypothetical protein
MFKGSINTFVLVINYMDEAWTSRHVIVRLFELHETNRNAMALQLKYLLKKIGLIHQVIASVKDEGNNLGTMDATLLSMIDYESLKFLQVCKGTCFGHVMSKTCKYVTNDDEIFMGLTLVSVKDVQNGL